MRNPFHYLKALVPKSLDFQAGTELTIIPTPKVANKQQSFASYLKSVVATKAQLTRTDLNAANVDITSEFRNGAKTPEVIRNLARATPDLSAAISANLRVGIPEAFKLRARNADGSFNREATQLAMTIARRFDLMPDYISGFSQVSSLRSVSEALGKELQIEGACSLELVLDKNRMPFKLQPVAVSQLIFFPDGDGLRPVQRLGGIDTDLDIPTFFYVALDPSLLDAYPQSPLEAAVQPVLASSTFLSDMRRVCARHVYPRYDISINEEKLRDRIPPNILGDEKQLNEYLNGIIESVELAINNLGIEEAIIHFDFFEVKMVEGGNNDVPNTFETVKNIYDGKVATGAKTMPSVLGHGSGSQNVASTETMLFMLNANGMIRMKLNELYSKAFTLAVRLFGLDVTVDFSFDPIDLRPASELESFRTMAQSRVLELLSLGFYTDDEASIELTGQLTPVGFAPLAGTGFFTKTAAVNNNPLGNKQGALQQNLSPDTPQQPKGPAKKAELTLLPGADHG